MYIRFDSIRWMNSIHSFHIHPSIRRTSQTHRTCSTKADSAARCDAMRCASSAVALLPPFHFSALCKMVASRARRSAATAAAIALLASCDVPQSAEAFTQPLHIYLSPPSPTLGGTHHHLQRSSSLRGRFAAATTTSSGRNRGSITSNGGGGFSLQSSFSEKHPVNTGSDKDINGDEISTHDAPMLPKNAQYEQQDEKTLAPSGNETSTLLSKLAEKVGVVDESRIAFPELTSGEVPRLYR